MLDALTDPERVLPGQVAGRLLAAVLAVRHGGSIAVESAEGAGSTFTVRLPIR